MHFSYDYHIWIWSWEDSDASVIHIKYELDKHLYIMSIKAISCWAASYFESFHTQAHFQIYLHDQEAHYWSVIQIQIFIGNKVFVFHALQETWVLSLYLDLCSDSLWWQQILMLKNGVWIRRVYESCAQCVLLCIHQIAFLSSLLILDSWTGYGPV